MKKTIAVFALVLAVLAAAMPAVAQTAGKIPTIGFLHPGNMANSTRVPAFIQGLRDLGYPWRPTATVRTEGVAKR